MPNDPTTLTESAPARHAAVSRRLGMAETVFDQWLGQRLGSALSNRAAEPATWEDAANPNYSSYMKSVRYPELHPAAIRAVVSRYHRQRAKTHADVAFITAVAGRYDTPKWHEHLLPNAEYLLYSDVIRSHPFYSVRPFPLFNIDPTRMARFIKTHPHVFAQGYKLAIWVDGNIVIRGDLGEEIEGFLRSGLPIGAVQHPLRHSVYEEAEACASRRKDDPQQIDTQIARYRNEGFQSNFLIESNLMMFRLDHPELPLVMNRWWGEIERGSRRDQLSLPYAIEQAGVHWYPITPPGSTVRNHRKLVLVGHERFREPVCDATREQGQIAPGFQDVKTERIAAQRGRRMDVVVCVHNALECVQRCLLSVAANRDEACHRIIIVNDGSEAETTMWLRDFAGMRGNCLLIEHDTAHGYTRAANAGMAASDAEALVLLNSDTEVAPHWIEKFFDAFDALPGIGIVGPMSNAASHQSVPDHRSADGNTAINDLPDGYDVPRMDAWCEKHAPVDACVLTPLVHGFCFAIHRKVREAIGGFDEEAFPFGYGEENDFCLRASNAGFLLGVALHTFVFHEKSQSFDSEKRVALMMHGSDKLRAIHGRTRVINAVRSMQENPAFVRLRHLSSDLPYIPNSSAIGGKDTMR